MPRIPVNLVQDVLARTDFVAVLSQYLTLRPSQGRLKGLCPFHKEKTPSFSVNPERGLWHCFGCHAGGDLFGFLMRIEGWSFQEAVREMGKRVGVDVDQLTPDERQRMEEKQRLHDMVQRAALYYHRLLLEWPGAEAARRYLAGRGIEAAVIERFQLGYAPASGRQLLEVLGKAGYAEEDAVAGGLGTARGHDMFRDRVTFPILDPHGQHIAMGGRLLGDGQPKYLNSPETRLFAKRANLYGLYQARGALRAEEAILVEGYMDVVALHQAGFKSAVASLGTALTAEQADLLRRYGQACVLAYDADTAGINATDKGIAIFETAVLPVRVVEMPAGDDPDSIIRREGADAFRERLHAARGIVEYRMETLLRKHAVDTPEGKNRFLNEILPTLATVRDAVRWDEYVRILAERLRVREDTVRRLAQTHRPPTPGRAAGPSRGDPFAAGTPMGGVSPAAARAERELIRYLLANPQAVARAREAVPLEEIRDTALHAILACLYSFEQLPASLAAADLAPLLEQEGVHNRLSELLMDEKLEPLTPQLFEGLIKNFQVRRDKAERQTLRESITRNLADRATRRHDDPDFVKFQQLEQRLKGS